MHDDQDRFPHVPFLFLLSREFMHQAPCFDVDDVIAMAGHGEFSFFFSLSLSLALPGCEPFPLIYCFFFFLLVKTCLTLRGGIVS